MGDDDDKKVYDGIKLYDVSGDDESSLSSKINTVGTGNTPATKVDIHSLKAVIPWLTGLKEYLQQHTIPDLGSMVVTKDQGEIWFSKLPSATAISTKHSTYLKTAVQSYQGIIQSLDVAIRATQSIIDNYQNAEHNNKVSIAVVDKAFADNSSGPGTSGTSAGGYT